MVRPLRPRPGTAASPTNPDGAPRPPAARAAHRRLRRPGGGYGGYGPPGGYGGGWGGGWGGPPPAAKPGVIPLRPLGVGEILDGAVSTMRTYWRTVLGISLTVAVLTEIVVVLLQGLVLDDATSEALNDPDATLSELGDAMADTHDQLGRRPPGLPDRHGPGHRAADHRHQPRRTRQEGDHRRKPGATPDRRWRGCSA